MMESNEEENQEEKPTAIDSLDRIRVEDFPYSKIKTFWNRYFTTPCPTQLNLALSLHKYLYAFYEISKKDIFDKMFEALDLDGQFYEVSVNYSQLLAKLSQNQDQQSLTLHEMFSNFQYEASHLMQSLSLILHYYFTEVKFRKAKKVCLVILNFPETDINQIRAHMVENFITFQAVVLKVYQMKLMPVSFDFNCGQCKAIFTHMLVDGNFTQPIKCKGLKKKDCKGRSFNVVKQSVKCIFIQRIKVQEIDSAGRIPRQILCEMRENTVGKVITGETVTISGVVKTECSDEKDKKTQGIFVPYIQINSFVQRLAGNLLNYDMRLIEEMKNDPSIFYSIIKSFCPTIYGHEIVKAGLLLGIIGGSNKHLEDDSNFRETSHVLLLGDPGIGKSQLLKYAVELLPHSVYVNATATSNSGLTVTVNKDGNQQSLEAGALILADNGVCAIDQFDKAADTSSLLEVMEQQTVSIAKAGIICQLKCRVGIIASANPINGCYNQAKSFKDNTKISNAILSRFDLIFLLVDKPDPERDKKLSQHIMKIHNQKRKKKPEEETSKQRINYSHYENFISIADKYSKTCQKCENTYTLDQMKKYMSYIRCEVHPTLSSSACEVIKGFYIALRENNPSNSFQITNRQLQSLVRLSMARARIQGRTIVTEDDAVEITQLMQESLFDSFEEMGYNINSLKYEVKRAKINKKTSELSLPKQKDIFVRGLREQTQERDNKIWDWGELVKLARELDLNVGDFYTFIQKLNQEGLLLQKGNKKYSFQGTFV